VSYGRVEKLKWGNIRKHTYIDKGVRKETVEITVKPETSKVRKERTVLGFGNTWKYISQVKEISNYTKLLIMYFQTQTVTNGHLLGKCFLK
jgi:hypothetical protein